MKKLTIKVREKVHSSEMDDSAGRSDSFKITVNPDIVLKTAADNCKKKEEEKNIRKPGLIIKNTGTNNQKKYGEEEKNIQRGRSKKKIPPVSSKEQQQQQQQQPEHLNAKDIHERGQNGGGRSYKQKKRSSNKREKLQRVVVGKYAKAAGGSSMKNRQIQSEGKNEKRKKEAASRLNSAAKVGYNNNNNNNNNNHRKDDGRTALKAADGYYYNRYYYHRGDVRNELDAAAELRKGKNIENKCRYGEDEPVRIRSNWNDGDNKKRVKNETYGLRDEHPATRPEADVRYNRPRNPYYQRNNWNGRNHQSLLINRDAPQESFVPSYVRKHVEKYGKPPFRGICRKM